MKKNKQKILNPIWFIYFLLSVFGLDSPLLFPPGMDPGKLYNPLMEMPDPRSMHPHPHGPYLKKKNKCKYYNNQSKVFSLQ